MGWIMIDPDEDLVVGDDGFDIMGDAVEKINQVYNSRGPGRNATRVELERTLGFVVGKDYFPTGDGDALRDSGWIGDSGHDRSISHVGVAALLLYSATVTIIATWQWCMDFS